MNLHSDYPFWLIKNGIKDIYPTLDTNIKCDVLITGGGISGALACYSLVKKGYHVVLIDRRHIASGSTCASTALIQYETDSHLTELQEKYGIEKANRSLQLSYQAVLDIKKIIKIHKIDCDFKSRNTLYVASTKSDNNKLIKEFEARKKLGYRLQYWDENKINSKFPFEAPGAIWSDNSCEFDPFKFTASLINICKKLGAEIHNNTSIEDYHQHNNSIVGKSINGFNIKAKQVVVACGYESEQFLKTKKSILKSTYAIISEPVNPADLWFKRCMIWESARPYLYMRTTNDNRIIVGGKDEDFYNPGKRDALLKSKSRELVKAFNKKFPDIKYNIDFMWCGTFGESKDGLPYIGKENPSSRKLFALGFGGNGITFGQLAAGLLPDIISKKKNSDILLFSFQR